MQEFDHSVGSGSSSVTSETIPAHVMVFAVSARVLQTLDGTVSGWSLGTADAPDRFGAGMGTGAGAYARGLLSAPMSFYSAEPLVLTAADGAFAGGSVRLAIHYYEASLPGA